MFSESKLGACINVGVTMSYTAYAKTMLRVKVAKDDNDVVALGVNHSCIRDTKTVTVAYSDVRASIN